MNRLCIPILAMLATACAAVAADAQTWPTRPLRLVVPYAAGSTADIVPRAVAEQLARELGQGVVVENRPGAGGTTGSAVVARAEPDGHTVLVNSSAHAISPALYPRLGYDPVRDFVAVVPLGISPNVLVVPPAAGVRTVGDLVAAARARPGGLNFSSVGVGTATHMSAERFRAGTGIDAVHVPFKGGAEAMTEVMAGRIDFFFGPVGLVLPNVREGRLLALAVNGEARASALPDVPTLREAGIADAEYPIWFGFFVPARTPAPVVEALHRATVRALNEPKVRERLGLLGIDPMPLTVAGFGRLMADEVAINARLVAAVGVAAQ